MSNENIKALQLALGIEPADGIRGPRTTFLLLSAAEEGRLSVDAPAKAPAKPRTTKSKPESAK